MLPLRERKKFPFLDDWSRYCDEAADPATFEQWMRWPGCNVGVCLGTASGVTALDFDDDVDGLHGRVLKLIGESPVAERRSSRRFTASVTAQRSYNAGGVPVLDVLAAVMPPSVHPEGMPYRWLTERTLENTPRVGASGHHARGDGRGHAAVPHHGAGGGKPFYRERSFDFESSDDVTEALSYLTADDYDLWIRIGMGE